MIKLFYYLANDFDNASQSGYYSEFDANLSGGYGQGVRSLSWWGIVAIAHDNYSSPLFID